MARRVRDTDIYGPRKYEPNPAYGIPPLPRLDAILSEPCKRVGCGRENRGRVSHGWIQVRVGGSTEPARVYCSGLCATRGVALAELRIADSPKAVAS